MSKAKQFIQPIRTVVGEADIDIGTSDYTSFQTLMTLLNSGTEPVEDVVVRFDLDKTTTGFVAKITNAETIIIAAGFKVNGTDYRAMIGNPPVTAIAETVAADAGIEVRVGTIMPAEDCRIMVKLSAETSANDVELPYRVNYRGVALTITAVEA